ncbi:peptide ABC transporter substrate-binding protein [Coxiella burnetii]|uniref:Oligopeptide-binding protein n=1 Tax=Coxiella burnetii (strain Dugway 5J108-111) TaxID=434922 RepID=A9KB80_COXBN|nr:ABC transporter substrate-binding protein [Coxiella burnetii]ABS77960.1 oligopeptide-binding protein [Coxiella burnetii Dugway 5J108-111]OYK81152.1 peptide ABC transporter substrate-binding protein [Coxiella burnetii]OYK83242.1 peptide ABC transporter substrate-binding protein [Coxiella burnetii]
MTGISDATFSKKKTLGPLIVALCLLYTGGLASVLNNPHKKEGAHNVRYAAIVGFPKSLDPARAYSSDEIEIIAQIYEAPLQYHYLKRPYQLIPLTARTMPIVSYYDRNWNKLPANPNPSKIGYSVYEIAIKSGIYYQAHPAFAKNKRGNYLYLNLNRRPIRGIRNLMDFPKVGTRELTAADYVYEIKRLASPNVHSPIFGLMSKYIVGFSDYSAELQKKIRHQNGSQFLDLRRYPLAGVKIIDRYHYRIVLKGVYPQFKYWLAMTFFAPIPWEADAFYSQQVLIDKNITLDFYPVGTGPYRLVENNPHKQIVLVKNPNFHGEWYPSEGEPGDLKAGYLKAAEKPMPFINKIVFTLEKESIPRWNKFLQGYYDKSGISPESFDQAIAMDREGKPYLTPELIRMGVQLQTTVVPGIFYIGFNMLDTVVGGYSEKKKKLRQAIAIALDYEEFISIFHNGRGIPAQGPIAPRIFGYVDGAEGINPYVYEWFDEKPKRRSLTQAKRLLAEAGYPGGVDPKTGKSLILNYDVATTGGPDDRARFDWIRKQFAKLGITLNIRATLYNRFREKVQTGKAQIFSWGWLADYPDPENFLFLLYSPNGKVKYGGENATNYSNPKVDELFEEIRTLPDGPERQEKINQLVAIVREDAPWIFGMHPINFTLSHQWNEPAKLHGIANNTLKYERIDPEKRAKLQEEWNQPVIWPLLVIIALLIVLFIPLMITYWRRERRPTVTITSFPRKRESRDKSD